MEDGYYGMSPENNLAQALAKALKSSEDREQEAHLEAGVDPLTGIWNRRTLEKELPDMITRLNREGHQRESDLDYVLVFISDINRFKFLNDGYGHLKGDEVLKMVAKRFEE